MHTLLRKQRLERGYNTFIPMMFCASSPKVFDLQDSFHFGIGKLFDISSVLIVLPYLQIDTKIRKYRETWSEIISPKLSGKISFCFCSERNRNFCNK